MNKVFKIPASSPTKLTTLEILKERLKPLVGAEFILSGKSRTDGSNLRKLIASRLEEFPLPKAAIEGEYEIVPPKKKGIPKIVREFIDTYIVTSGKTYNLQVWNRIPSSQTLLIKYESGEILKCNDVRFILTKIDVENKKIASIIIATPKYIVEKFGVFGKPTIKHQLLISTKIREKIYASDDKIMFFKDSKKLSYLICHDFEPPKHNMTEEAKSNEILSIELIKILVAEKLIGYKIPANATKNRGQALEKKVLELLDYPLTNQELLHGGFPDIPNQLLEVKVQDTQTVDLGKFSPEKEEVIIKDLHITTFDIRYLIALTNPKTEIIEGIILSPGEKLGDVFSYVSDQSYKCQRSIPMDFFEKHTGKVVINPD
ncbi:hypothetical protein KORDIASMS9_00025 [Kordia sp. SMS9]|uniref:nuclease n=1 Tax=Kordia sp. SMS9 TaxID=2282170 RepID=UPI000E0D185D|nr:nuclease [Kordia sp. SMS9]AXG67843.1 hypothetical protein KORDIASMS9_00025 [Kordia sp. SMS9]